MVMAKIKVSQATIDKIKAMGMTKALKTAATGKANAEMREGLKRMYGAKRLNAAETSTKPYNVRPSTSADMARSSANKLPVYKSADAARAAMPGKGPMVRVSTSAKKSTTTDPFAKAVFAAGRAVTSGKLGASGGKTAAEVAAINKARAAGTATPPKKSTPKATVASVAAINAKRMGISVAEYNKRLAAKKNK
jgi:hypothetical protein